MIDPIWPSILKRRTPNEYPVHPPGPIMLNSCLQVCKNQGCKCSTEAPLMMNATAHGRRFMIRNPARNNFAPPNPKKTVAIRYEAAPRVRYMNPAMIAPVGPIKFCAGLFGGLTELNQPKKERPWECTKSAPGIEPFRHRVKQVPSLHSTRYAFATAPFQLPVYILGNALSIQNDAISGRGQEGKNSRRIHSLALFFGSLNS